MLKDLILRILNQTVGEYFENIDSSQLQVSVLSGNIALHDLVLKKNVCDSLGLPFHVSAGRLATFNVKFSWTGLYTHPVEVDLRDLYLLIVPGSGLPYNEEMEERVRLRLKRQLLENIEAAQKELIVNNASVTEPGYFEKMALQIVKNLQIRIRDIHLRYEDAQTNPGKNFAFGIVLTKLSILTTDSKWTPRYVTDNTSQIHKLLDLGGLAFYWNSNSMMLSQQESNDQAIIDKLKGMLQTMRFDCLFGPISIVSKLRISPNPDKGTSPFTIPKILFDTLVPELAIGISNFQFQDMLHLAASWEFLYRREHYRKFRPHGKPYRGNYRLWWYFAYDCILEDIQRRRNNWRWSRMSKHRTDCKNYYQALYQKIIGKHTNSDLDAQIEQLERDLDILNILIIRKQIDLCRVRWEKKDEATRREQGWSGWFKGFIGAPVGLGYTQQDFAPELTTEEKTELLVAIGFSESSNAAPINYPPEYVESHVDFRLDKLKVIVTQDYRTWNARRSAAEGEKETILDLQITQWETVLDTRPVNQGMSVVFRIGGINAYGGDAPGSAYDNSILTIPHMIAARKADGVTNILDMLYERAPLGSEFNQRLRVYGQPLDITYDAPTVQKLTACFTLPTQANIMRLQSTAMLTYKQLKARSSTSLRQMMEGGDKVDIDIHLEAPCLIIPHAQFGSTLSVIVVELGELVVTSQLLQADT